MDLQPLPEGSDPLEDRIWGERILRSRAGDRPGGLMREIGHDFPVNKISWEIVLRRLMVQPLLPQTVVNWNRPSRRTLSLGSQYIEPSVRPKNGIRMAGVVIDTSGSIDESLLTRFAREVQGIQERTGCEVLLMSADAAVQTEQIVRNDGVSLARKLLAESVQLRGGGGTDFFPALQRMREKHVCVVVYLTDLYGDFGSETRYPFPLIWATPTSDEKAPFGETLYIG